MFTKNKKNIAWGLLVAWMIFIFYMSNQPGDVSSEQSKFVVYLFSLIGLDLNSHFGELATFIIRKGAHFTEYMILYFLTINVLKYYVKSKTIYLYSLVIVFGYACTDEIHQLFVEGRAGKFTDVMIDTSGGIFGMLIVYIKNIIRVKINKKDTTA